MLLTVGAPFALLGGYAALTVLLNAKPVDSVIVSARRMAPEHLNNLEVLCTNCQVMLSRLQIALQSIVDAQEARPAPCVVLHQIKSQRLRVPFEP